MSISAIAEAESSTVLATCPSCGETMAASREGPQLNVGFEVHTLECMKCGHLTAHIVRLRTSFVPGPNAA